MSQVKTDPSAIERFNSSEKIYAEVVEKGESLAKVPSECRHFVNQDIYLELLKQGRSSFSSLPKEFQTAEFATIVARSVPKEVYSIPAYLYTEEIAVIAMKAGLTPRVLPEELKTPKVCLASVKKYWGHIEYVPRDLVTQEMFDIACAQSYEAAGYSPKRFVTPEIKLRTVRENGMFLKHFSTKERTPELCMEAVSATAMALEFVPPALRDLEICRAAVARDRNALKHVPIDLLARLLLQAPKEQVEEPRTEELSRPRS